MGLSLADWLLFHLVWREGGFFLALSPKEVFKKTQPYLSVHNDYAVNIMALKKPGWAEKEE